MTGKLYVIGVGPGDPELLTLKAARILNETACLCVPKGREEGSSLALSIVKDTIDIHGKEIIEAHFPMRKTKVAEYRCELDTKWHETVEIILSKLIKGIDVAFITIGDPTIYSTFFYLYDRLLELNPELHLEVIPGVSSINASAAKAGISLGLGNERIAILPANYTDALTDALNSFDTVVLMKVHKVFDTIVKTLKEMDLLSNAIYVSRAGMEEERIIRDISNVRPEDLNYFSLVIIRKDVS